MHTPTRIMPELKNYLKGYFFVPENDLDHIASLFKKEKLNAGEYFVKAGHYADKLSFVNSGILRIFLQTENKEVTQWIATEGYFLADLRSLIFGQPARWFMQAETNVELFSISKEDYKKLATIIPASKSKVLIQFLKFTQNRMAIIRLLFKVLVLAQR